MRIEENGVECASIKHLVFAYYVTGHGFGHATRVVEVFSFFLFKFCVTVDPGESADHLRLSIDILQVVRNLIVAGHDVHVVTGAPDFVFTSEIQSPRLFLRKVF